MTVSRATFGSDAHIDAYSEFSRGRDPGSRAVVSPLRRCFLVVKLISVFVTSTGIFLHLVVAVIVLALNPLADVLVSIPLHDGHL